MSAAQGEWLARLDCELPNVRASLAWALEEGDVSRGLRIASALWTFWLGHGHAVEGRQWLDRFLAQPGAAQVDSALRIKALRCAAILALELGDYPRALAHADEGLALARLAGDGRNIVGSLSILGNSAYRQGDFVRAATIHTECLGAAQSLADPALTSRTLNNLGLTAEVQGDTALATRYMEESLAIKRQLGDTRGIAMTLNNLGLMAVRQGNHRPAQPLLEKALLLLRGLKERRYIAGTLLHLGHVARYQGNSARALVLYRESLTLYQGMGDALESCECLGGLAAIYSTARQEMRAARLLAVATAIRESIGASLVQEDVRAHAQILNTVRTALGDHRFAVAWAEGAALPLEQAIVDASSTADGTTGF